ncbi:sensor histidine kinase [Cryptosporangium aurantiacum]|uniref:histidine kinase n=1 Tax=Cryptosporangium aurantiacum TaxID=134849 RepID=A0A1M7PSC3_9ACTN|nr:histidine kinase [Cryptosporangium aurantiacum]SHN20260.1 Signal transduction histidine kinase [Cryptosporangium aurantiacum]
MNRLLRLLWDEPPPPQPPAPVRRDRALLAVLALFVLLEGLLRPDLPGRAVTIVVGLGLLPTLLWRRSRPLLAVVVAFGVTGVAAPVIGAEPRLASMIYLLLLPYGLFRWGSGREIVIGSGVLLAKVGTGLLVDLTPGDAAGGLAVLVATAATGTAIRYRANARARELDQVKLVERERLARDLHDTVAHHVSAMAIRAQAGIAVAETEPGAAVDALRVIEAEASRTLAEMRSIVRVLRSDEAVERLPAPRAADLARLAGDTAGGPHVDVRLVGDLEHLPPPIDSAIYRLGQESVTNARRHARHATRIDVRVVADGDTVQLRVSDDGEPGSPHAPGYGILGMIERADLLGGHCAAGPAPDRGWTVDVVLPRAAT